MNKKHLKRFILGAVVLTVVIPGGLVYRQYRADMSLAYQRVSSGGKMIETACGPIQYTEFGDGAPMLIDACENGRDHDQDPVHVTTRYKGFDLNVGFYSRLREINPDSSFSVNG